jgi:hypothetical protein
MQWCEAEEVRRREEYARSFMERPGISDDD